METVKKLNMLKENNHDIVFVFNKTYEDGEISHALCLCCNDYISFNEVFHLHNFWEGIQEGTVNPLGIIDVTDMISVDTLNTWNLGENIFAKRAREKFVELNSCDGVFSFEDVKQAIIEDIMQFVNEVNDRSSKIAEYTTEEVCVAIQSDDNMEIMNAVCEECIDLCSEGVKKKIK